MSNDNLAEARRDQALLHSGYMAGRIMALNAADLQAIVDQPRGLNPVHVAAVKATLEYRRRIEEIYSGKH